MSYLQVSVTNATICLSVCLSVYLPLHLRIRHSGSCALQQEVDGVRLLFQDSYDFLQILPSEGHTLWLAMHP